MMKRLGLLASIGALLLTQPVYAAGAPLQLIQPGDKAMSCEALAAEINSLSAAKAKTAQRAEAGRKARGFMSSALTLAGPMLGGALSSAGGDGTGALIAQQAIGALQTQQMSQAYAPALEASAAGVSLEVQRMARLSEIYAAKGC